jgi:hypothetical protein
MEFLAPILQALTLLAISTVGGLVLRYLRPIWLYLRALPWLYERVLEGERAIGALLEGEEEQIARVRDEWRHRPDHRAAAGSAPGTAR